MREINNFAGEIPATVERTSATSELVQRLRQTQRRQAAVGSVAVLLLLGFAGLLLYYKKSFLEHAAAPQPFGGAPRLEPLSSERMPKTEIFSSSDQIPR